MNAVKILVLLIQLSIALTVLSFGMMASWDDVIYLFRRPGQLIRALLSINVIMAVLMLLAVTFFEMNPAVEVALVALAVSPVPPLLPGKAIKVGASRSFALGLLAAISLFSIVVIPIVTIFFNKFTANGVSFSQGPILTTVVKTIIVPIVLGLLLRRFAPAFSEHFAGKLHKISMIVLLVAFLPIVIGLLPTIWSIVGGGTMLALIVFTVIGIMVGHFLGGPDPSDRTVLALATTMRHPGIAIALANANVGPTQIRPAIAAIILYLLLSSIVAIPYVNWFSGVTTRDSKVPEQKLA